MELWVLGSDPKHLNSNEQGQIQTALCRLLWQSKLVLDPWTNLLGCRCGSASQIGSGHCIWRPHHVTMHYGHIIKTSRHVFRHYAAKPASVGRWVVPVKSQVWEQKNQVGNFREHANWTVMGTHQPLPSELLSFLPVCLDFLPFLINESVLNTFFW